MIRLHASSSNGGSPPARVLAVWPARSRASDLSFRRRGFTLFELIIVLVLLSLVGALTVPTLNRLYSHHHLRQAVDLLGVRISSGRVHAVETGLTYQFRYEPGGRRFLIVPYDQEPPSASGAPRATRTVGMLPAVCKFEGGNTLSEKGSSVPSDWLVGLPDAGEYTGATYSGPALFHPDGTATDMKLIVHGPKNESVELTMRALTGAVTVSQVTSSTR